MNSALYTRKQAIEKFGSESAFKTARKNGELFQVLQDVYSLSRYVHPYRAAIKKWPTSVITMHSALYYYGLTDSIPDITDLATARDSVRIVHPDYRQYFIRPDLLEPGVDLVDIEGTQVRMYSKERLLVEVIRMESKVPVGLFREIISSYRDDFYRLNIRAIERYVGMFQRNQKIWWVIEQAVM